MPWFTFRNRRLRRDKTLDVKARQRSRHAQRLRFLLAALTVCFVTFIALVVLWRGGEWIVQNGFIHHRAFRIRQVQTRTDGLLSPDQIRSWSGAQIGDPLFVVDLNRIKRNLELVPLVREARVERVFPDTLRITIAERQPCARALVIVPQPAPNTYSTDVYLLDSDGYVMVPLEPGDPHAIQPPAADALPNLIGLQRGDLRPGWPAVSPSVYAALQLIQSFERSPMFGLVELEAIDLSHPGLLHVTTRQGTSIAFSLDRLEPQLRRWRSIHDLGRRLGKSIATIDLSVTNNVPVTWIAPEPHPPSHPTAPLRTTSSRRRHV